MAFWQWSKTTALNASVDPTINWAEGQSPSSVNDSARAMMARAADWRDDVSGTLPTSGSGTALVVSSYQGFGSLADMDGTMICIVPNITNTGPMTLSVDGLVAKPIRTQTGSAGNLGAGVIIQATPYVLTYYNTVGEFLLQGFVGQPFSVPIGSMLFHSVAVVPNSNFVMPIGQAISRTTYATYFTQVGTIFGVGDGTTTFNIPDLRSRMIVPLATMGGADPGIVTTAGSGVDGATIGAKGGLQSAPIDVTQLPVHSHPSPTDSGHRHKLITAGLSTYAPLDPNNFIAELVSRGIALDYQLSASVSGNQPTIGQSASSTSGLASTTGNTGSAVAINRMPPVIVLPIILRVI